jgi:dTDP-4-amino-4,6-dideoxygalactose transaminase
MSNIVAGIGRGQMEVLPERVKQRRAVYQWYNEYFQNVNNTKGYNMVLQPEAEGSLSNRWLTAVLINPEQNKGVARERLHLALEQENIESRPLSANPSIYNPFLSTPLSLATAPQKDYSTKASAYPPAPT